MFTLIDWFFDKLPGSVVVYATALAAGLSAAAGEITDQSVSAWLIRAAGWLSAAVVAYRRMSPVAPEDRGLRAPSG